MRGFLFTLGFMAAGAASAQFVSLSQCQAAYPCAFPFGLQYRPDPLIAGHYGRVSHTALSARVELRKPLTASLDKRLDMEALDAAARKSLQMRPLPKAQKVKPRTGEAMGGGLAPAEDLRRQP